MLSEGRVGEAARAWSYTVEGKIMLSEYRSELYDADWLQYIGALYQLNDKRVGVLDQPKGVRPCSSAG